MKLKSKVRCEMYCERSMNIGFINTFIMKIMFQDMLQKKPLMLLPMKVLMKMT